MTHRIPNIIVNAQLSAIADPAQRRQLLMSVGIKEPLLNDQQARLNATEFARLMRTCYDQLDDEAMCFSHKPLRVGTFRMLCHATINCGNVRRAILQLIEFFRLLSDEFHFELHEEGEEAFFVIHHQAKPGTNNDYFIAMQFTIFWRYLAWLIDAPLLLNRCYFVFEGHGWQHHTQSVFDCPVFFQRKKNAIIFPISYLNRVIKQDTHSLGQFLADSPENILSRYEPQTTWAARVKARISELDECDTSSLESLANTFNCSAATLSRRLKQEGHQFLQIKDKVRRSRTIQLLLNTDLSISQISSQLGFSEDAVFYRTFKKWTGLTPKAYRDSHQ
jgi:AraC-like DNA-binding protein